MEMLHISQKRTSAAAAIEGAEKVEIVGLLPMGTWGGIETSAPIWVNGEPFILYRMNCGTPEAWHRAKLHMEAKNAYFKAFGQRRRLAEIINLPKLTGCRKAW